MRQDEADPSVEFDHPSIYRKFHRSISEHLYKNQSCKIFLSLILIVKVCLWNRKRIDRFDIGMSNLCDIDLSYDLYNLSDMDCASTKIY